MLTAVVKIPSSLEDKFRAMARIRAGVRIGFLGGATYADTGESVAYIAYLNEYGSSHNPPRPFMHRTAENKCNKWSRGVVANIKKSGFTQKSAEEAFEKCGMVAAGDVKRVVKDWPPGDPRLNSPATIARKRNRSDGSIDPEAALIDSGTMIANVTYEVVK